MARRGLGVATGYNATINYRGFHGMSTVSPQAEPSPIDLEPTPAEVKRYQRPKLVAMVAVIVVSLVDVALVGIVGGPALGSGLTGWLGERDWLKLIVVAAILGIGHEVLTLPLDFWSGFVLEHRYHLSNQTVRAWIVRRLKGYMVGALIGLPMLL